MCSTKKYFVFVTRHPYIPPTTPVLYNELCQWIIIGLIHWKSQKKDVKSNLGKFLRKCKFNFFNAKIWPIFASFEPSFCSGSIFLTFWIELMFPKVKNMELLEQKERSKLAKIGHIFALKKLNLHFIKNFPRFDFTAFFSDFQCIRPIIIHWQSSWYRTGVVGGMHGWRVVVVDP